MMFAESVSKGRVGVSYLVLAIVQFGVLSGVLAGVSSGVISGVLTGVRVGLGVLIGGCVLLGILLRQSISIGYGGFR